MNAEEYLKVIGEQKAIIVAAQTKIEKAKREFVESAPIKVGDIVELNGKLPIEKVKVVSLGVLYIGSGLPQISVGKVRRYDEKKGDYTKRPEWARHGVRKDGITYPWWDSEIITENSL